MKKRLLITVCVLITLFALIGFGAASAPVNAQDAPPATPSPYDVEAIYRAAYAALNAGDLEGNLKYYADDAITIALPPPPEVDPISVGKAALREWTVIFLESHPHIEFTDFHVHGETLTIRTVATDDFLKASGVGYLEFSGTAIVREGLIVMESYLMDHESLDRLIAADTLQTNKQIVGRFYDEIFSQGNLATADEILDENFGGSFSGDRTITDEDRGLEGFKEFITFYRTMFPDYKVTYQDMVAEGDIVVVNITGVGTYQGGMEDMGVPASVIGKQVTFHGTDYARIVNGKIVDGWGTHDDLPWLQQLGLKLVPEAAEETQAPTPLRPGDSLGDMTLSNNVVEGPPIWAFCSPVFEVSDCTVPAFPALAIGHGWWAIDEATRDANWTKLQWQMFLDDQPVDLESFGTVDGEIPIAGLDKDDADKETMVKLRSWNVVLENLTPGTHVLRSILTLDEAVDDGYGGFDAGVYEAVVTFTIEEE